MLTAIIAIAGVLVPLLGILLWYLKRRDAGKRGRDNDRLRKALAAGDLDIVSDILRRRMRKDDSSKG